MKKVLIITYYWPPSGGPGVQRALKFAKYLPQFGWEPVILTVDDGNFPALDEALLDEIPEGIKVYKTKTLEPFVLYNRLLGRSNDANVETFTISKTNKSILEKLATVVRNNLFIPDARKGWKKYAVKAGLEIIEAEKIDAVFSSSPPHSLQIAAKLIAKFSHRAWVADFRDPWSKAFWLDADDKGYSYRRNFKKESSVFRAMDYFTTVSQGFMDGYLESHPHMEGRCSQISNGFDGDDIVGATKLPNKIFTIRYIGTLAKSQNPVALFEALSEIKVSSFMVEFWGKFDASIAQSAKDLGLQERVSFHPYISHEKAVDLMLNSDMLLLVIPFENSKGILTGKMYEYIATRNPIIGLGPRGSEASTVIEANNVGKYFFDKEGMANYIENTMLAWANGESIQSNAQDISVFSREYGTEQLSKILNKLVE